ncbi:hypothetical protein LCGC14_1202950 [marine sediment metagenome]|uniref:Uncharacterized protein n=1 Tax=marine sediment metagenome TaxID=412755 RepID=A0A0F9NYR9_9ZZZZ
MDFFLKNLKETIEAINKLMDRNITIVNTKRIRRCNNIKSSNRSKINFIWRTLDYLKNKGMLEINGFTNPKTYKINVNEKIEIDNFLSQAEKERKNRI